MTIFLIVLALMLGLVVGAYGALALQAASQYWRTQGMRELTHRHLGTVGNGPDTRLRVRAERTDHHGHDAEPEAPPPPELPPTLPPPRS